MTGPSRLLLQPSKKSMTRVIDMHRYTSLMRAENFREPQVLACLADVAQLDGPALLALGSQQ